ncbi:FAD-dependent oxidoreductase [Cryptosporangium aurantiacum]|uniref:NADPH-dependent 2,4-dienoyl-CoA reductase, sulfur reductase n=1 Tax=Cryptosporangium aurantiacum TaxID=134849 RepID=A0A1M7RD84_9ACTN|nr:FAD-dependent oxidoreductase [Cryptosporangium aurantiacum]SHN44150.1 NADPH-dependent 2,4-dienoyl-CoA reductase, sulfur reductase [Cryptosporangium aurantiacum]
MAERLIVVGADAAGMSAASQARRRRDHRDLEILAFERGTHTSYSACGIPYWIAGLVEERDDLIARTPEQHRERNIDVRIGHTVVGVDLDRRAVTVREPRGGETTHEFDQLMVATGGEPVRPDWPGIDGRGVHGVQTLDDGEAVSASLRSRDAKRAVVIGGGYIGVEMAEALIRQGLEVTLVERAEQPMNTLDPDMGERVGEALKAFEVDVRMGVTVEGIELDGEGWARAVTTDAGEFPADVVVLGLGTQPGVTLAEEAGLPIGPSGGIVTDRRMRVPGHDGIWAAGDCVEVVHRVTGRPVAIPLGTHANKQGRVAGINLGGGYATFPGVLGTAVTKVCDLEIARTGLREAEAEEAGFAVVSAVIESHTVAGYYPGADTVTVKLVAERGTGRLLGGQIVGGNGAAKRIDVVAVALWNHMTVDEMTGLDLGYAPPFSPVWDPVLVAARAASDAVHG